MPVPVSSTCREPSRQKKRISPPSGMAQRVVDQVGQDDAEGGRFAARGRRRARCTCAAPICRSSRSAKRSRSHRRGVPGALASAAAPSLRAPAPAGIRSGHACRRPPARSAAGAGATWRRARRRPAPAVRSWCGSGERRAQFVADVGGEFLFALDHGGHAAVVVVDGVGQFGHLAFVVACGSMPMRRPSAGPAPAAQGRHLPHQQPESQ
jgi:hypothetical protein